MKLTQYVNLISSSKPIDFEKNRTISKGKVAILIWKIFISCLRYTICIYGQIFLKLVKFVYIFNNLNHIDFKKKMEQSVMEK